MPTHSCLGLRSSPWRGQDLPSPNVRSASKSNLVLQESHRESSLLYRERSQPRPCQLCTAAIADLRRLWLVWPSLRTAREANRLSHRCVSVAVHEIKATADFEGSSDPPRTHPASASSLLGPAYPPLARGVPARCFADSISEREREPKLMGTKAEEAPPFRCLLCRSASSLARDPSLPAQGMPPFSTPALSPAAR